MGPLLAQHQRFCKLYLLTRNARYSSFRAGFSKKHGYYLLGQPAIQEYLAALKPEDVQKELEEEREKESAHGGYLLTQTFVQQQVVERILAIPEYKTHRDAQADHLLTLAAKMAGCIEANHNPLFSGGSRTIAAFYNGPIQDVYFTGADREKLAITDPRGESVEREHERGAQPAVETKDCTAQDVHRPMEGTVAESFQNSLRSVTPRDNTISMMTAKRRNLEQRAEAVSGESDEPIRYTNYRPMSWRRSRRR